MQAAMLMFLIGPAYQGVRLRALTAAAFAAVPGGLLTTTSVPRTVITLRTRTYMDISISAAVSAGQRRNEL